MSVHTGALVLIIVVAAPGVDYLITSAPLPGGENIPERLKSHMTGIVDIPLPFLPCPSAYGPTAPRHALVHGEDFLPVDPNPIHAPVS